MRPVVPAPTRFALKDPALACRLFLVAAACLLLSTAPTWAHGVAVWAEILEDGRTLHVEVYYSDGQPVAGARIDVFCVVEGEEERIDGGEADERGRFDLELDGPAELVIRASAPGSAKRGHGEGGHGGHGKGGHGGHGAEARIGPEDFPSRPDPSTGP